MTGWPITLALLVPLALMLIFAASRSDGPRWALPLASLPALALALLPAHELVAPALLLGARWRTDDVARPLLLLIGIAWSAAGWFAASRVRQRFRTFAFFWLAALAGLLTAALAAELASFYTGYVAMTLAAYGLVLHERSDAARRAARVYLVLALGGEALVLSGVLLISARLGNAELAALPAALTGTDATVAATLFIVGFAVKMGLVPLHLWLPVAHPVAPVAASAILSGVLVKAGLLGALRLVPEQPFEAGGSAQTALLAVGFVTAFYGAAVGLCQSKLKVVLAYSTVSQMGLVVCGVAAVLAPGADRAAPLIALLVLHHGLNKAALFIAAGSATGASTLRLALFALPALALVGLPFTSGELAKSALKSALGSTAMSELAPLLLGAASVATALLMLRAGWLARAERAPAAALHPAWPLLAGAGLAVPWAWLWFEGGWPAPPGWQSLFDALWPAAAALMLAWFWRRLGIRLPTLPAGDVLIGVESAWAGLRHRRPHIDWPPQFGVARLKRPVATFVRRTETALATLPAAGVLLLSLAGLMWWALR